MEQQNYNFIERLLTEAAELFNRLSRLSTFILISDRYKKLDYHKRQLLKRQHWCMTEYLKVLNDRISDLTTTLDETDENKCSTEQGPSSLSTSE